MSYLDVPNRVLIATALTLSAAIPAAGEDSRSPLPLAPPGTRFTFEVVECLDAAYLGDTPSHVGRSGGLKFRPRVALGDRVYRVVREGDARQSMPVGRVTHVIWERVSGGLTVEVDPDPLVRLAVGDELWIDLNPAPPTDAPEKVPTSP